MDSRHIIPAIADSISLAIGAAVNGASRARCIEVARTIRREAFDAKDSFPTVTLPDLISQIGQDGNVVLPQPSITFKSTIGGLIPYYYLGAIVRALSPKVCFEIGTYLGLSALTMALNTPSASRIFTVDLPEGGDVESLTKGDQALALTASGKVGIAFAGHGCSSKISQIRANSLTLDARQIVDQADFCFIDGGHTYDLIKADTENCLQILSQNGVIMWDDYRWGLPGVAGYLRELLDEYPLRRIAGTQYVVYIHR